MYLANFAGCALCHAMHPLKTVAHPAESPGSPGRMSTRRLIAPQKATAPRARMTTPLATASSRSPSTVRDTAGNAPLPMGAADACSACGHKVATHKYTFEVRGAFQVRRRPLCRPPTPR